MTSPATRPRRSSTSEQGHNYTDLTQDLYPEEGTDFPLALKECALEAANGDWE